jgi:hypothetical protein
MDDAYHVCRHIKALYAACQAKAFEWVQDYRLLDPNVVACF